LVLNNVLIYTVEHMQVTCNAEFIFLDEEHGLSSSRHHGRL